MPGYSHLDRPERDQIADLKAQGLGVTAIARAVGRHPSTISRELRRNTHADGTYRPVFAEGSYRFRRQRAAILETDTALTDEDIQDIAMSLNLTPRKCLGFKTPAEALLDALGKSLTIRFNAPVALRG